MTSQILSKASFAELAGMTRGAITKSCRKALKAAVVSNRVDASHPVAIAYLESRGVSGETRLAFIPSRRKPHVREVEGGKETRKRSASADPYDSVIAVPDDMRSFLDFTLRKVIERFGTDVRFLDFLNAAQKIEMIHEKQLKNARIERELVSRKLVQESIIDVFEAAHLGLMTDGAKSIAAGAMSKHASGAEQEEVERYVSDIISSFLKQLKIKVGRVLAGD